MKKLECSSIGDRRFSAFYAEVTIFGLTGTIEGFYQMSKRFGEERPWKVSDCKGPRAKFRGKAPTHIEILGKKLPVEMLTPWYNLLWYKYLRANPQLARYAAQFDEFSDRFRGKKTINCQADCIRVYVKEGPEVLLESCRSLLDALR